MKIIDISYYPEWDWQTLNCCGLIEVNKECTDFIFYNYNSGKEGRENMISMTCENTKDLPKNPVTADVEMQELLKEFYPEMIV